MMIDIAEIRKNYQKYDDEKIIRIAKNKSRDLREDVLSILISEIEKRDLNRDLITWIKAESKILSGMELETLKDKIKGSTCEFCKKTGNLKGFEFETKIGFIIGQNSTYFKIIACEDCGKRKRKKSGVITFISGWWSVWGLFSMPFLIVDKIKGKIYEDIRSNEIIEGFIEENVGNIILAKEDTKKLQGLIRKYNTIEENMITI